VSWGQVTLGSICDLVNGKAFKPTDWSPVGLPIIRIQNLNGPDKPFNYWAGTLEGQVSVKTGDLLLAWSGTPGTSFGAHIWNGGDSILNQHIFRCDIDRQRVLPKWAKFAVNTQLNRLIHLAHGGVGLKHVTRHVVEDLRIPLPPIREQRRIAEILDKADSLLVKRRVALAQLDTVTQSVFLGMFGDPIRNGHGYPTKQLVELVDQSRGITYGVVQRGEDVEGGVPIVRITDVIAGEIDASQLRKTALEVSKQYRRTVLRGGEIVVSIRGTVGRCALVPHSLRGGNITRELALIPYLDNESTLFCLELLRSAPVQQRISGDVKGIAQRGLNLEDLRELPVIQPHREEIRAFTSRVDAVNKLKVAYRASLAGFDGLFASLQHRAFRGQLSS
jgi:type I restriction enzyme S subunit